jgi:hypothetical protein
MAHKRVRYHSIELAIGNNIELSRIAGAELNQSAQPFFVCQALRGFDQIRAEVYPCNPAREIRSTSDRTCRNSCSAAHIEHGTGRIDIHRIQVLAQHLLEEPVVSSGFKPQDDDIEEYVLQFVSYPIGI